MDNIATPSDDVILVDEHDNPIGQEEKLKAHQLGLLHRAFSIFIYQKKQSKIHWLLQQRQPNKYHSGGRWSNSCCSHPKVGETLLHAAQRRLMEELGFCCTLKHHGHFIYYAKFDNTLSEHELDHVFVGEYNHTKIAPNPQEVSDVAWVEHSVLHKNITKNSDHYTPWLAQALTMAYKFL